MALLWRPSLLNMVSLLAKPSSYSARRVFRPWTKEQSFAPTSMSSGSFKSLDEELAKYAQTFGMKHS